jgi:signal transduction histidine kinase
MRRLPALGLRGRIVAALVLTSAVVLGVAALFLLTPLEHRLQREETSATRETAVASRPSFEDLEPSQLRPPARRLSRLAQALERRTGARVAVFDGSGRLVLDTQPNAPQRLDEVSRALGTHKTISTVTSGPSGTSQAHLALPMSIDDRPYALQLTKPLDDASAATSAVRRAFTIASIVGLAVALLLGIWIAHTLVRRLHRLRDATLLLAGRGGHSELASDPARDEVGDLGRAFATMQRRIREQEEARRSFVATASHELRTPLASLRVMLELLEEDLRARPPDLADAGEQAAQARIQSERLARLASDLLDLSRIDADTALRSEPVELGEICRAVAAEFDVNAGERLSVELGEEGGDAWGTGDPGAAARIIRILIDNALRFSPPGEPVVVAVQRDDGSVRVSVADRGPGVPEGEREVIFDRFQRGSAAHGVAGFGLGLAIGAELARRMGGSLAYEPPEEGARFVLRLPAAELPNRALTGIQPHEALG